MTFTSSVLAISFLSTQPGVPFWRWVGPLFTRDLGVWSALASLGALAVTFAMAAFLVLGIRSATTAQGRSAPIAKEVIEKYTSEVEASSTTGVGVAAVLGLTVSGARTKRALPASHADVVRDFERLVRAYRGTSKRRTILVLIDELDRLPIDTIEVLLNEIKDFFHIDGVRVVVSVSDEVLNAFHGRRTMGTDVFDSSFDTVFEMRSMSVQESVSMVNERVVAVPARVTFLCHAISGGRPRELLRACSTLVQETWDPYGGDGHRDALGVSLVERQRIVGAAEATIGAIAMEECRRLQRTSAPGSRERRLGDEWAVAVARGSLPEPSRRAGAVHPHSGRLFLALLLIRRHLAPHVAAAAPAIGPDPLLPTAEVLAKLVAAVRSDEHVWRSALAEAGRLRPSAAEVR